MTQVRFTSTSTHARHLGTLPRVQRTLSRISLVPAILACSVACLDRPVGVSKPVTTNVVVERQVNNAITGIDLLLMIDNSSSMADKQKVLASAVPQLLGQLVQPQCLDANDNPLNPPVAALLGASSPCPQGSSPEFNPVNNIHVGIVTSSLGDHGYGTPQRGTCYPGAPTNFEDANGQPLVQPPDMNDMSHLMGTLTRGAAAIANDGQTQHATVNALGFLAWGDPSLPTGVGDGDLTAATKIFTDMVTATAEAGCGFEAQMEGWFRFLVNPVPPVLPLQNPDANGNTHRIGVDDTLLAQRAGFLRPDSLVAIVVLSDETDCSARDTDVGWVADNITQSIITGSAPCNTNPNDKCCYSCTAGPPSGCQASCPSPAPAAQDDGPFQANIRFYHQKRRFGYEFMYPTSRYVVGLTNPVLCPDQSFGDMDCNCTFAKSIGAGCDPGSRKLPNPLYSNVVGQDSKGNNVVGFPNAIPRQDNSNVFLAGIIGVPWQDVGYLDANGNLVYIPVTDPSWTGAPVSGGLAPITSAPNGIWQNIYADDNANVVPGDPHMIESLEPRPGIGSPTDPVNGHEWNTAYEDLEYACISKLPAPKPCPCSSATAADYEGCKYQNPSDCCDLQYQTDGRGGPSGSYNKPLCQADGATGNYEGTQYYFKAYPGVREIQVLRDYALNGQVQGNSIVASICTKDLSSNPTDPGYGYNPAVAALISRLKEKLKGSCLPRQLTINSDGTVPCNVVEVVTGHQSDCSSWCTSQGRGLPSDLMSTAVTTSMQQSQICDTVGQPACSSLCQCLLYQESSTSNLTNNAAGSDLAVCQDVNDGTEDSLPPGYCYVDPGLTDANGNPLAGNNPALVANCPLTQRRILRFVGNNPSGGGVAVPMSGAYVFTACQGAAINGV